MGEDDQAGLEVARGGEQRGQQLVARLWIERGAGLVGDDELGATGELALEARRRSSVGRSSAMRRGRTRRPVSCARLGRPARASASAVLAGAGAADNGERGAGMEHEIEAGNGGAARQWRCRNLRAPTPDIAACLRPNASELQGEHNRQRDEAGGDDEQRAGEAEGLRLAQQQAEAGAGRQGAEAGKGEAEFEQDRQRQQFGGERAELGQQARRSGIGAGRQ